MNNEMKIYSTAKDDADKRIARMEEKSKKLTGLDDGPPLPRAIVNGWKGDIAVTMRSNGSSFRAIAEKVELSHEGIREILRKRGVS